MNHRLYIKPAEPFRNQYPDITEYIIEMYPDFEMDLLAIGVFINSFFERIHPFYSIKKAFTAKRIRVNYDDDECFKIYIDLEDGLAVLNEEKFKVLYDRYLEQMDIWNNQIKDADARRKADEYAKYLELKKKFE